MKSVLVSIFVLYVTIFFGQTYTSYFTGNSINVSTQPQGGICLMGGATEDDNAMRWFLQRANGGDILVLRTSGSNGYNSYLYSGLGVTVNSVETIVCNSAAASYEPYVIQKIQQAEAIWFAGGNQWTYISYWRNTPLNDAINQAIQDRNIVIGGTSAGMAIMGKFYFTAQNGTITSANALSNPYHNNLTISGDPFINNVFLNNTITDTHFDNPDRRGRLVTFLARIITDNGISAKGIACDEYTAVCIDTNGIARVFGGHPTYDDNAYFIQTNCELGYPAPENCIPNNPLTWNLSGLALKVYQIKGDSSGSKTFNLNNWQSGSGGTWLHWFVNNGSFVEQTGSPINCSTLLVENLVDSSEVKISPNPTRNNFLILTKNQSDKIKIQLFSPSGQNLPIFVEHLESSIKVDLSSLSAGIYFLTFDDGNCSKSWKVIKL